MPPLEILRVTLAGIALAAGIGWQSAIPGDDLSVLFVGNSLTERHDLPGRVRALAADAGRRVHVSAVTRDGASLADHWDAGQVQRVIASRRWSFVVLQQGPSTLPASRAELVRSARQYAQAIRAAGGQPALLMVWPLPGQTIQAVAASYRAAAEATGATLIPAGEEWARARARDRRLVLTEADGFHPSEAGTEIAARAVVRALWDRPAPDRILGPAALHEQSTSREEPRPRRAIVKASADPLELLDLLDAARMPAVPRWITRDTR